MSEELKTAQFWTLVEGESEQVRTFALIPPEWADKLDQHPQDDEIFYWCNEQEWIALGAGEVLGDAEVIACACDECEQEGECDTCSDSYDVGSQDNRCGNCGNCGNCCTHNKGESNE
jgi:hypothetical protein